MKKYMTFDELFRKDYLSWPKVGESTELIIEGMTRIEGDTARKWGTNGFDICLSKVNYGVVITDDKGRELPIRSWEVYFEIKRLGNKVGTEDGKGLHLKISHIKDGNIRDGNQKKGEQLYNVFTKVDGVWKRLNSNNEWIN